MKLAPVNITCLVLFCFQPQACSAGWWGCNLRTRCYLLLSTPHGMPVGLQMRWHRPSCLCQEDPKCQGSPGVVWYPGTPWYIVSGTRNYAHMSLQMCGLVLALLGTCSATLLLLSQGALLALPCLRGVSAGAKFNEEHFG